MFRSSIILTAICFTCFGINLSDDSLFVNFDSNGAPTLSYDPILTIDFDSDCTLDTVSLDLLDGKNVHSILFSDSIPGIVILPQRSWVFQFNKISDNVYTTNKLNGYKYFKGNSINFYSCLILTANPDSVSKINMQECEVDINFHFNNSTLLDQIT
jgi:hypothetical protein